MKSESSKNSDSKNPPLEGREASEIPPSGGGGAFSSLINEDLAPVPPSKRTWGTWNYAALWISMSLCIPTYMLASSLIGGGMNWWQAILVALRTAFKAPSQVR